MVAPRTVTDRIEYSPYGTITHRTGTSDTPFLYAGQFGVMTEANGLLHMRARDFNPFLRCFINADPIRFDGGMNWYAYASGNPANRIDPRGTADGGSTIAGSALGVNSAYAYYPSLEDEVNGSSSYGSYSARLGDTEMVATAIGTSVANNSGMTQVGSNLKLYAETSNGRVFRGNQYVRTTSLSNVGRTVTRVSGPVGHAISAGEVVVAAHEEGGFGPNTQVTAGQVVGGTAGGAGGAYVGALIGAPFGGVPGAVMGGFIGGVVGGFGGSYLGGEAVEYIQGN